MKRIVVLFSYVLVVLFMSACATKEKVVLPLEVLYEQGTKAMQEKKYSKAITAFKDIRDNYPFSDVIEEVELSLADSYFLAHEYLEAAETYKEFEMLYPRHKSIPYVLYQIAFSYQATFISIDREIDSLKEAKVYYQRLIDFFPNTSYGTKAKEQISGIVRKFAERDIYLANFYWRTEKYGSAWKRYQEVIKKYPEFEDIVTYAKKQSPIAYLRFMEQEAEVVQDEGHFQFSDLFKWL